MSRREDIRHAKEIIAQRRASSINTFENHVTEVSARVSEFDRINKLISSTGSRIFASAIGKNNETSSIDDIHSEYDSLVLQKKKILVDNGYPEDYCDIKYHCTKCSDTGYHGIDICDCLKKEIIIASLESSGLYHLIKKQSFSTFSLDFYKQKEREVMEQNLRILKEFVDSYSTKTSCNFLFVGATGLGKTHLSSAVAINLIEKGAYVVYESAITVFADYEEKRFGNSYAAENSGDIEKYTECDLLIIDDLGAEMTNQFTVSCLYNIINTRLVRNKSTIVSTNISQNELRKRYSDRIVSRLFGEYKPLVFLGTDIREQKIRNSLN